MAQPVYVVQPDPRGCLHLEELFLAVAAGIAFRSWWVFGIAVVAAIVIERIRVLLGLLSLLLSLGWGVIGFQIGGGLMNLRGGAPVVLGALGLLLGGVVHWVELKEGLRSLGKGR
jgi:hypothetical protein